MFYAHWTLTRATQKIMIDCVCRQSLALPLPAAVAAAAVRRSKLFKAYCISRMPTAAVRAAPIFQFTTRAN